MPGQEGLLAHTEQQCEAGGRGAAKPHPSSREQGE
jgi:hypothetical protein